VEGAGEKELGIVTDCVLHIGSEKTGTTSIQATFAANRERLLSHGILYPRSLGERIHARAYAYASEGPLDEIKTQCGLDGPESLEDFRRVLATQFADEVASARPDKIIVSNEHFSSRLLSISEVARLQALVSSHCRSIKVVAYLRAQGDAHRSAYSTYVKTGGSDPFHAPTPSLLRDRYRYDLLLRRWEHVFGAQNMDVRIYDPAEFPEGDVLLDFADLFDDLISTSDLDRQPPKNGSLDSFTLAFLRSINRYLPYKSGARVSELRGNLNDLVETFASGHPFEGDPEIIAAIDAAAADSNEAVRRKYFPERPAPLFSPAARTGAASPEAPEISDEAARLMALLWEAKQTQVLQLRRRLDQRDRADRPVAPVR
jgi:hypothetical protein